MQPYLWPRVIGGVLYSVLAGSAVKGDFSCYQRPFSANSSQSREAENDPKLTLKISTKWLFSASRQYGVCWSCRMQTTGHHECNGLVSGNAITHQDKLDRHLIDLPGLLRP